MPLWEVGFIGLFSIPFYLGRCDSGLYIFKFPFVKDKVSQIFNGILVYIFHEGFNVELWDFKVD